jgi:hypothetical protein
MKTQRLFTSLAWLLIAAALVTLFLGRMLPAWMLGALKDAVPAGLLVALAGNLFTQGKNAQDSIEKRSAFFLDASIKAYEQAKLLLADSNSDRAVWIEAARCLGHAKVLSDGVTLEAHQRILELNRLKYRSFFHQVLSSQQATFFYGVTESDSLDSAARASTAREERNGRVITSTLKELAEPSMKAIWEAAQWPENYNDPMGENFSDSELNKLIVIYPELHRHLEHRRQWHSASGRLFPRS